MGEILGGGGNPAWHGGALPRRAPSAPIKRPSEPEPQPFQPRPIVDLSDALPAEPPPALLQPPMEGSWYNVPGSPGMRVFSPKPQTSKKRLVTKAAQPANAAAAALPSPRLSAKLGAPFWVRTAEPPRGAPARPASANLSARGTVSRARGGPSFERGAPSASASPRSHTTAPAANHSTISAGELERITQSAQLSTAPAASAPAPKRTPVLAWPDPDPSIVTRVAELPRQLRQPSAWKGHVICVGEQPPDVAANALHATTIAARERLFPPPDSPLPAQRPSKRVALVEGVRGQQATLRSVEDLDGTGTVRLHPTSFFEPRDARPSGMVRY